MASLGRAQVPVMYILESWMPFTIGSESYVGFGKPVTVEFGKIDHHFLVTFRLTISITDKAQRICDFVDYFLATRTSIPAGSRYYGLGSRIV